MERLHNLLKYRFLFLSIFLKLYVNFAIHNTEIKKIVFFGLPASFIQVAFSMVFILADGLFFIDNILCFVRMKSFIQIRIGRKHAQRKIYLHCSISILILLVANLMFTSIQGIPIQLLLLYTCVSAIIFLLLCKFMVNEIANKLILIYFLIIIGIRVCNNFLL